jgi:hypothetical protein
MKDKTVSVVGLGYVKPFCKQKPLLKMLTPFFLLRKKKDFFGKAFFSKERFMIRGPALGSESYELFWIVY